MLANPTTRSTQHTRRQAFPCLALTLCVALLLPATPAQAEGVIDHLPDDALAALVVRDLGAVDEKTSQLIKSLGVKFPRPLAFVQMFAGIGPGYDTERDLMIVLLPGTTDDRPFQAALWLPVTDYAALVRSLEGDPEREIAAVTIAGEDLLVTEHGDWAVVMDPDQRARLSKLRNTPPAPPTALAAWNDWITKNDVALVMLPGGVRAANAWLTQKPSPTRPIATPAVHGISGTWKATAALWQRVLTESPAPQRWLADVKLLGCGISLDEAGDVRIGLRAQTARPTDKPSATPSDRSAPGLFDGGEYVLNGLGRVSPRWSVPAVGLYINSVTTELKTTFGCVLPEAGVGEFRQLTEQAVAEVRSFGLLTEPGEAQQGVFTGSYVAVRVASAEVFLKHATAAIERWNEMMREEGVVVPLLFESRPVSIAERPGTEWSVDMASPDLVTAFGDPPIEEFRRAIQQLFGPGGKFRLQWVAVDDQTVLLGAATEEQAAEMVKRLRQGATNAQAALPSARRVQGANAAWHISFSPSGYVRWLARQRDAVVGPAIGGPLVRPLPATPPIDLAGGSAGETVWLELSLPGKTLQAVSEYAREQ